MKILIVTGQLAADKVQKAVSGFSGADVLVLPTAVASLITPQKLISGFSSSSFTGNKYDAVLVSGFSKFDFSRAEAAIGCPVYLGPKHAVDLSYALTSSVFSKIVPACEFIQAEKAVQVKETLNLAADMETFVFEIGRRPPSSVFVKPVSIGGNSRMKILAEIVRVETFDFLALESEINHLIAEGADMVDLGFSPDADEKAVFDIVSFAGSVSSVPISADVAEVHQIQAAFEAGADLLLSLDGRSLSALADASRQTGRAGLPAYLKKTAVVVIPDLFSEDERLQTLEANLEAARSAGFEKIIADPVLSPAGHGLMSSMTDYFRFHQKHPDIPVLFGAGNVTELYDADSIGMNALLAAAADECGASILFTPDASDKGKGSVRELRQASDMILLSNLRHSSPKDLGIDLLVLKEKRKRPDLRLDLISQSGAFDRLHLRDNEAADAADSSTVPLSSAGMPGAVLLTGPLDPGFTPDMKWGWKPDKAGNFIIGLISVSNLIRSLSDRLSEAERQKLAATVMPAQKVIVAVHPRKIVIGTDSAFMLEAILNENLISELSHAGYLGRELQKAELALHFGRSYAQDDIF